MNGASSTNEVTDSGTPASVVRRARAVGAEQLRRCEHGAAQHALQPAGAGFRRAAGAEPWRQPAKRAWMKRVDRCRNEASRVVTPANYPFARWGCSPLNRGLNHPSRRMIHTVRTNPEASAGAGAWRPM